VRIGRWGRALGGRARNPGTGAPPSPAISELRVVLTERRIGSLQLFEKLTGSQQLWWRCCRDAARVQPSWLLDSDHYEALQVISDTELAASQGAVSRAALAADLVCRALAAPPGPARAATLREVAARAADQWHGSLAVLTPGGASFAPETAAASAVPHLQDRLRQVLACLDSVTTDARQAMVAICALLLAADQRGPDRVVSVPVVFARPGERPSRGVAGTLELREFPSGPAGLFPDPRGMRNRRGDPAFADGLRLAWKFAATGSRSSRCVLWRLSLDGGAPDYAIDGGSLGAAFAVALRELLRVPRGSRSRFLAAPRAFFIGLRPRCAITGALATQRPPAYEHQELQAPAGLWLNKVGNMDAKLDAARAKRLRLVAPAANRAPEETGVDWADTVHQADRYARRVRPVRTVITVMTVLAIAGIGAVTAQLAQARSGVSAADTQAAHQHAIALSLQLAAHSEALGDKDPDKARLEAAAAWRIAPTTQARYALRSAANLPGIAVLPDPDGYQVLAVAFSPGGSLLATGSGSEDASSGAVQLWDAATHLPVGGPLRSAGTRQITALAFGDGGNVLAAGNLSGGVQLWNLRTRRAATLVQPGGGGAVTALAFGPDGILAVGADKSTSQSQVKLWDIANGKQVADSATATYGGEVSALAFSPPDGRLLAVGTASAGAQLWKVRDGRLADAATTLPVPAGLAVAFSPDGHTLATSDGSVVSFWDSTTLRRLGQLSDTSDQDPIVTLAFGKDGAILATGTSTGPARLWDVASHAAIGLPLTGAGTGSPAVAFGPDGVTLAVATTGGTELWNTTRDIPLPAKTLTLTNEANSVAFNAKTGELAAGDGRGLLQLWDDSGSKPVGLPVNLPRGSAYGVAFSPDGRTIAVTGSSGTRLWEASDGELPAAPAELLHSGLGVNASFSPDGKTLAIGGVTSAQIWDVAGHRLLKALSSKLPEGVGFLNFFHVTPMAFSPDGKLLAVDTDGASVQMLGTVTYKPSGENIDSPDEIYSLAFSPDSKVLAVGSATGTQLWDTQTRNPIGPPMPSDSPVWSVAYSPDGTVLAMGTGSGIELWDTASDQPIGGTLTTATGSASTVDSLAFSHDGRTLAAGIATKPGGSVQLWDISYLNPAATEPIVCAQAKPQTLTKSQWAQLAPGIPDQYVCSRPPGN
jgi:WD40 repeat protein